MHDDNDTEFGLALTTLEAMQQHREGEEETDFHPSLSAGYERPAAHSSEGFSAFIGGLLLLLLFLLYAFSGNL